MDGPYGFFTLYVMIKLDHKIIIFKNIRKLSRFRFPRLQRLGMFGFQELRPKHLKVSAYILKLSQFSEKSSFFCDSDLFTFLRAARRKIRIYGILKFYTTFSYDRLDFLNF